MKKEINKVSLGESSFLSQLEPPHGLYSERAAFPRGIGEHRPGAVKAVFDFDSDLSFLICE